MNNSGEFCFSRLSLRGAGLIGTFGMLIGVMADLSSGYSTVGAEVIRTPFSVLEMSNLEAFLASKPHGQVVLGHYLAIAGIPLGLFGLWQVVQAIKPAGYGLAQLTWVFGIFTYIVGTVFHASFAYITTTFRTLLEAPHSVESILRTMLDHYVDFFEPLAVLLIGSMVLTLSLIFYAVLFRQTHYPKCFATFNPLVIQLLIGVLAYVVPHSVRIFLIVTTYNLSLAVFYFASTLLLWHKNVDPVDSK